MKTFYSSLLTSTLLSLIVILLVPAARLQAQSCSTAQGDQTTYGTNNVWIGYVYRGENFNNYQGYVSEGSSSSPDFNEGFGGGGVTYNTNGCSITTDSFSVRYKLTQTFASGTYVITVGGDDGYRFSMNSDSSYLINNWTLHSYTTTTDTVTLNGTYNFVLEFFQNTGGNEVSFNITKLCMVTGDQTIYGTNNVWLGYLYQGENFQTYKGTMTEGSSSSPSFDENFGNSSGSNTATYYTTQCSVTTYQFSARYRLAQTLPAGNYTFTAGGDDGFRLSLDGGNTWVINKWEDQSYVSAAYSTTLSGGTYNTVLEYYQNGGYDRVTYTNTFSTLPITINSWSATLLSADKALLKWTASDAVNFDHFIIQRSTDDETFQDVATVAAVTADSGLTQKYSYTDQFTYSGNVYYRLAEVDHDGTTNYSTIVSLPMQASAPTRIYPTVVTNGQLNVESSASINQAQFQLFDMKGQKLLVRSWPAFQGTQQVSIGSNLAPGAYIALLSDAQSILTKQIIIVK